MIDPQTPLEVEDAALYAIAFGLVRSFNGLVDWGEPIDFRYENDVKHVFRLPVAALALPGQTAQ